MGGVGGRERQRGAAAAWSQPPKFTWLAPPPPHTLTHPPTHTPTHPPPTHNRSWFSDTWLFWSECTKLPCEVAISPGERFVYCLTLGFYVQVGGVCEVWVGGVGG